FPADYGPDFSDARVEHRKRGSIAAAPNQALHGCRHDLAMFSDQVAFGIEKQRGAVQRAAVTLDYAHHQVSATCTAGLAQSFRDGTGHIHGAFVIATERRAAVQGSRSYTRAEVAAFGI